jgi:hypothetical protein
MGEAMSTLCGCIKCQDARELERRSLPIHRQFAGPGQPGWRYACETCGCKRCPHHSDHELACTGSNETRQVGSVFQ